MRSLTAFAALSLLALTAFGVSIVHDVPVTPDGAVCHAESVTEQSDTYEWLCYDTNGHLSRQTLEIHVDSSVKSDVLRQGTVLVKAPILLVDPEDPYVVKVADHILSVIEGGTDYQKLSAALCFVQKAIHYASDEDLYGTDEYWSTPSETLRYHAGDCEDTSVLLISILGAMGIDSVLLDYPGHEAVGAYIDSAQDYLYCETASDMILLPGQCVHEGEPDIYVPGEFSPLKESVNGAVAAYRDFIKRVTGA